MFTLRQQRIFSAVGFGFAALSGLLAIAIPWYASAVGGYPFYDPVSLAICWWGVSLSLFGLLFSIGGTWRSTPHRFRLLAPVSAAVMFMFWILEAATAYQ